MTSLMPLAQVKSLLIIASQLSGYPIPKDVPLPPVMEANTQEIAKEACDDSALTQVMGCGVIGFYEPKTASGPERIFVVTEGADQSVNSIAVHELTHFLQYHNWPNPSSRVCPREFRREYEAYTAGIEYTVKYEHKQPEPYQIPGLICDLPEETK